MRILLIDAMAGLYRSYYSSKIIRNSHGEPINALRRYLQLVDSFQRNFPCDEIIFCEDAPRDTLFRQQLFVEYKQGRKPSPQELLFQKSILFGFLRKIGFPVIGVNGYEADDIIGTLSRSLSEDGHQVLIASSDKDMFQLLTNDRIGYLRHRPDNHTQELLFRDDIRREFGYWPEQVIDLKILAGDSSDNIRGIPGCGMKNAISLLQRFHSLSKMMTAEAHDSLLSRVQDYVKNHEEDIKRNQLLVTIIRDINPDIISQQLAYRVSRSVMLETMARYQIMGMEEFEQLSYYEYLMHRLSEEG